MAYDSATDPVHGSGWNSAARWGGWSWRDPARGEHFRRCSFCGSIHPGDLAAETAGTGSCQTCGQQGWEACFRAQKASWMTPDQERARVEALNPNHAYDPGGWYASWADRKYGWPHKFYVDVPNRDPGSLFVISSQSGGDPDQEPSPLGGIQWVRFRDLNRAQRAIARRDGYERGDHQPGWLGFGTRARHHAKFYTIHLADPAIGQDVKDTIQRVSGLRFTFIDDGRVGWEPWAEAS